MPEDAETSTIRTHRFSIIPIFLDSLKIIFLHNPKFFFTLYTLTTLPISLLLTAFATSSTPRLLKSHIARLELLIHVVPIRIEAANIQNESRADFRKLFLLKIFYGVPILVFSLVALITIVVSSYAAFKRDNKVTLQVAFAALRVRWAPPLLTSLVSFIAWVGWGHLDPFFNKVAVEFSYFMVVVVVVEVFMLAVFGLALVVSVVECRAGFQAVCIGWCLMRGRRVCGWVLSGLILLVSGFIGIEMIGVMDGQDDGGYTWTAGMRIGYMVGLVASLGWFVLWSYVIFAVFYFDCRKRHVIKEDEQLDILDDIDI